MELTKQTALEASESVAATLDWKLEKLKEDGLPVEAGLADYIALAASNYDNRINQLKEYKRLIDQEIKTTEERKTEAMAEVAGWLENNMGVDRLKGIAVSSITVKKADVSIRKKFVWDIDKEEAIEKGLAHYEEEIRDIPAGIRINKRRAKDEDK